MRYQVTPGGPRAIVLMHGWGCDSSTLAMIEETATETHTVYNVDFPGFGGSDEPPTVWGVDDYTRAIEALVAAEGIENPVLLGHSFGGRVGIVYSSRNAVDRLILVDAAGIKPRRSLRYYVKVYSYKLMKRWIRLTHSPEDAARLIEKEQAKRGSSDYAGASPRMRAIMSRVVNEDLKHCLPLINAPTLLIWGVNDTATPIGDARIMEKMIPDAGLVAFDGCGHYSFLDNPAGFTAVLRSFLKSK